VLTAAGVEWRGRVGDSVIEGPEQRLVMSHPVMVRQDEVYVPIELITDITGLELEVDSKVRVVRIGTAAGPADSKGESWEEFTVEKTVEEKDQYGRTYGPKKRDLEHARQKVVLPPEHDSMRLRVGQGYVQGADWGTDMMGSGSIKGIRTEFSSQTAAGPRGLELLTGQFSLTDPDFGWRVQGGDLFSDIWGWARGAGFGWNFHARHQPAVSYYARTERFGRNRNVSPIVTSSG
jgi:hypothetical protein